MGGKLPPGERESSAIAVLLSSIKELFAVTKKKKERVRERKKEREEQTNEGMKKHKMKYQKLKTKAWKKDTLKK